MARSEFILFSTVTEQSIFDQQRLHDSLVDLETNAPKTFSEIIEVLNNMAKESIDKGHQISQPARGALAVDNALKDYFSEVRS